MQRYRIVNGGADPLFLHETHQPVAVFNPDNILIIDMIFMILAGVRRRLPIDGLWQPDLAGGTQAGLGKEPVIDRRIVAPATMPIRQVRQLDLQDHGLQRVQAEVAAHHLMLVTIGSAMDPDDPHLLVKGLLGNDNHPAVADPAQVLAREE